MKKEKYSIQQICKKNTASQRSDLMPDNGEDVFICPKCQQETFHIHRKYKIGYCKECDIFIDYKRRENKKTLTMKEYGLQNIVDEASLHLDEDIVKKEISSYCITDKLLSKYNVGYYPHGYWVNSSEDYTYGNMIFPLYSWDGNISNICAKYVGSPQKIIPHNLHFINPKALGVFNPRGFWNEDVNLFLDPMDCLVAIQYNLPNSIFLNKLIFPELVTMTRLNVFGNENQNVIIKEIKKILNKNIEINFYSPSNLEATSIFNYLTKK